MAKGNIILGYLRGSIGDITFFRAKGQQLSRARNRAPANPRTVAQMDQRAKMACAVKFFSQVGANFFKYAFEGKKETESYFNAFVKNNIYLGGYIGKQASRVFDFPALGAWQISAGTLPEIGAPFPQPSVNGVIFDVGTTSSTAITTVSGLTSALIGSDSSRWREGDILTCLCYCATNYATLPTIYTDLGNRALTSVWQIRLSTTNTDLLPSIEFPALGMIFDCKLDADGLKFHGISGTQYTDNLYCFGIIHSRRTPNGLKVSSSTMVAPQSPELLWLVSSPSGSYYNSVIADWQASEDAILQGGLSAISDVVGWSTNQSGPWLKNVISYAVSGSEPSIEGFSVKYSSADAAARGLPLIYARGTNGGTFSLVKSIYDDVMVGIEITVTMAEVNSTVDVYVNGEVAAHYYRPE